MEKNDKDGHQVIMGGRYRLGRLLGRGSFAKVYKAHRTSTGEAVAIKVFDKDAARRSGAAGLVTREAGAMRRARHPHVVRLHEVMATRSRVYFAMEYAGGGELLERLARGGRFPEPVARRYFRQLVAAVGFCHDRGVFHRDLKPENLLLDAKGDLKVSDFGLSAAVDLDGGARLRGDGLLHTACGTPAYVAPEVLLKCGYDGAKADIWSCGVILFVLLSGYLPFNDTNLVCLYRKIMDGSYRCPSWFSIEARKLLARLLDPNPKTRITIAEIKAHPWFQKGTSSCCPLTDKPLVITNNETGAPLLGKEACKGHHRRDDEEEVVEEEDEPKRKRSKVSSDSSPRTSNAVTPTSMNAFDIIARSSGLDLSTMFDAEHNRSDEARFSTEETASAIVSRLEEIAEARGFSVTVKETGRVVMEGCRCHDGRGGALAVEAEIFEVAPSVHVVELRNAGGDSVGFREFCTRDLKPSLSGRGGAAKRTATDDS
ncbi:hypothetical protein PR202_ga09591 [Eleusine coracana subsp. coracana]|uniref:non-specific serine/threonine protein kinase n=1 Tax=Eleusine coracana subsp. coracana TaxID=191504 RepID=A0AAV5C484_ELECO|nr:hypothetical protein QOZ80_1AG0033950 [Eleusine coracana subsp. coracana]GJM93067.1 hypothetical protein PR202_ga09591 [Eleusine coracana subsp. coracana]